MVKKEYLRCCRVQLGKFVLVARGQDPVLELHLDSVKLVALCLVLKGEQTCREYEIINVFFKFLLVE